MSHNKRIVSFFSKTNGLILIMGEMIVCCEKSTKYLNKICEGGNEIWGTNSNSTCNFKISVSLF